MASPQSKPSIPLTSFLPGRYQFIWEAEGITLSLFHLRERGDYLSAQVELLDTTGDAPAHLYGADRLSLASGESREKLVKKLVGRRNNVPWTLMLEQAANAVLEHYTRPSPLVIVGGEPMSKAPLWRLHPIMPEGLISVLTGDGGTGKSTLAVAFALCIQQGVGQSLGLTPLKGEVGYCDYESDWQRVNDLCLDLEAGLELPEHPRLHYIRMASPVVDEAERIRQAIAEHHLAAIIVDSAAPACGGERELKENASPMLMALASLGVSVLLISHVPKDEMRPSRKPYGSVFIHNLGRHHWFVKSAVEPGEDSWDVALYNTKSNVSKIQRPLGFHLDRSTDCRITRLEVGNVPELRKGLSAIAQIRIALRHGSLSVATLAEKTGLPETTLRNRLSDGKRRGLFINPALGLWALVSSEEEV